MAGPIVSASEIDTVINKFLQFTNPNTYSEYNFTLSPDPQACIEIIKKHTGFYSCYNKQVPKYDTTYVKYGEVSIDEFHKKVPIDFEKILQKYFKQYLVIMFLEIGKNGNKHYHGKIISTDEYLSEMYLNDLISNITFKYTSKFRKDKVIMNHPCIRIYKDNKEWESKVGIHKSYADYMCKESNIYYINTTYLSRYYQEKWLKEKSILININISEIIRFIDSKNILVTKAKVNIPKVRKAYLNKQNQEFETLICLKKMFKNVPKEQTIFEFKIDTDILDEIL